MCCTRFELTSIRLHPIVIPSREFNNGLIFYLRELRVLLLIKQSIR